MTYDLIIIGAGPAGLTACLYARRFGLKTLLMDKAGIGGYLNYIDKLENFPGFPSGIAGPELAQKITAQLKTYDFEFKQAEIKKIQLDNQNYWELSTMNEVLKSKAIIIAVGRQPGGFEIPGEKEFKGKGVSYCAMCDAPFFKNKDVVVIGGGNVALEEALYLTNFAKKVTIIHKRDKIDADEVFKNKVKHNKKINSIIGATCREIQGKQKVESIIVRHATAEMETISTDGVFIFSGMRPLTAFVSQLVDMDEKGYIRAQEDLSTSTQGVFVAGDCRSDSLPQVISACGEGAKAAHSVHKFLARHD